MKKYLICSIGVILAGVSFVYAEGVYGEKFEKIPVEAQELEGWGEEISVDPAATNPLDIAPQPAGAPVVPEPQAVEPGAPVEPEMQAIEQKTMQELKKEFKQEIKQTKKEIKELKKRMAKAKDKQEKKEFKQEIRELKQEIKEVKKEYKTKQKSAKKSSRKLEKPNYKDWR